MAAGVGLWNPEASAYAAPSPGPASATTPGGAAPSRAALFNLAFRTDEPLPQISNPGVANTIVEGGAGVDLDGTWWRERAQAEALASGDVDLAAVTGDAHRRCRAPRDACGRIDQLCRGPVDGEEQLGRRPDSGAVRPRPRRARAAERDRERGARRVGEVVERHAEGGRAGPHAQLDEVGGVVREGR